MEFLGSKIPWKWEEYVCGIRTGVTLQKRVATIVEWTHYDPEVQLEPFTPQIICELENKFQKLEIYQIFQVRTSSAEVTIN